MKIGNSDPKTALDPLGTQRDATGVDAKARTRGSAGAPADGGASATVQLSSTVASLTAANPSADFDAGKVERVSQAIRDGKYQVNPEVIADKLIANAQELLGRVAR